MDEMLTPAEAAAALKVARKTIYKWCAAGKLPHITIGNGFVRIPSKEVQKMIQGGKAPARKAAAAK